MEFNLAGKAALITGGKRIGAAIASTLWPLAIASVSLSMDGKTVRGARIVMGAVAPVPWRSAPAEASLTGKTISEEAAMAAADAAVTGVKPMTQNAYKVQIARTAVKRAIMKAAGMAVV